jgi:hypothetical protein
MPCGRKSPLDKIPPEKREAIRTLAKKMKKHPEITNPYALAKWAVLKRGVKVKP